MVAMHDGRRRRSTRSKAALLCACRIFMESGIFRPSMANICKMAKLSARTGFEHFKTVEALHLAAIEDLAVRDAIAARVYGSRRNARRGRIVHAIITGRA